MALSANTLHARPPLPRIVRKLNRLNSILSIYMKKLAGPQLPLLLNPLQTPRAIHLWTRRVLVSALSSDAELNSNVESFSMELPCLPFTSAEAFVPSSRTTLHLYEARFLALLDEAMKECNNYFVHFVLDPVSDFGSAAIVSFATRYGCLVLIETVKRLEIGCLVTIRGIGRVNITSLTQTEPYLKGVVQPMQDEMPKDSKSVIPAVEELKLALTDLHCLQIKLKTSEDEQLQTPIWNSLRWAEKEDFPNDNKAFLPSLAERISFAALQPGVGATRSELQVLLKARLNALESTSTIQRLVSVTKLVKESRAMTAAKLALQSLEL